FLAQDGDASPCSQCSQLWLLPPRIEVRSLAPGFGIVVCERDVMVPDDNRVNICRNDPDLTGIYGDGVVVENRLAIKSGLALVALPGRSLQCGFRTQKLSVERVPCEIC